MVKKSEQPWDSMFLAPAERRAAWTLREQLGESKPQLPPQADYISREPIFAPTLTFQENLEYIRDWTATELLGLIADGVALYEVDFPYLEHWRKNFQVPPDDIA